MNLLNLDEYTRLKQFVSAFYPHLLSDDMNGFNVVEVLDGSELKYSIFILGNNVDSDFLDKLYEHKIAFRSTVSGTKVVSGCRSYGW